MTRRSEQIRVLPEPGFTCLECDPNFTVTLDAGSDPMQAWREHYQAEHSATRPALTVLDLRADTQEEGA